MLLVKIFVEVTQLHCRKVKGLQSFDDLVLLLALRTIQLLVRKDLVIGSYRPCLLREGLPRLVRTVLILLCLLGN